MRTYWERASADLRGQLVSRPRLAKALEALRGFSAPALSLADSGRPRPSPAVPGSWPEWLLQLRREPLWPGAVQTAIQGAAEWAVSEAGTPEDLADFAASLRAELPAPAQSRLALSLPYILDFFVHRGAGIGAFLPVQHALFERLLYADGMSIETLRSAGLLLDALMRGGLERPKCALALEDLRSSWRDLPSFELLDWALDVFESVVTLQIVPEEDQTRFAVTLAGELARWTGRLTRSQVALFEQLCREARIDCHAGSLWSPPDGDTVEPPSPTCSPKSIALYSLRPEVLSRVANVVASVWPGTNVRVFSDHVGNDPLRTAARTADLFVIVTGAAKHAATEFIEANRPAGAATIRCHATGSAAVLRLLGLD
jgi:hypothetical protein